MVTQMLESVDIYGSEKVGTEPQTKYSGILSILTYVCLAIALYFKVDMIIQENNVNMSQIRKENPNHFRNLQDLISDPVVDNGNGGITSGGTVPIAQQNNTIPIVTPDNTSTTSNSTTPDPATTVTDSNAGNVNSDELNFRFTENI